jgi:hypothetical protein
MDKINWGFVAGFAMAYNLGFLWKCYWLDETFKCGLVRWFTLLLFVIGIGMMQR